ncbi:MAG: ABC transporter permease [Planctomycetota bacterium]
MWRRILGSRGVSKFRRDKFALVSLAVIVVYLGAAIAVALGAISRDETFARVGPNSLVGFFETPTVEQRIAYTDFYIDQVRTAGERGDDALRALDVYGLEPRFSEAEAALAVVEPLFERFEAVAIASEGDDGLDAAGLARLSEVEREARTLWVEPSGWQGTKRALSLQLGTDRQGRSILLRALYSIKVAAQIGLVAALFSVVIGTALGGAAAYFGGVVDHAIVWLYSTFSAIPYIVLLMVLASMFLGSPVENTLIPVYVAFCMTFWIGPCRVIRGEVMKLRELEYVQAATTLGFGRMRILLRHVLPNTLHLMFINFSLLFIGAIKAEVILSFLGLGVKDQPSWGVMIKEAGQEVIGGFFWQIGAATFFMFVLVLAFNVLSDALQDAFDPKHVG